MTTAFRLMSRSLGLSAAVVTLGIWAAGSEVRSQDTEAAFLTNFEGRFSGTGTVQRGAKGSARNINCSVTGTPQGKNAITIKGNCGVLVFRSGVNATIRYDAATGTYMGLWQDRNSTSDLSGSRSGNTLTLNIKRRGGAMDAGAKGQMVVRSAGPNKYQLTVSTVGDAKKPQRVEVTLQKG